MRKLQYITVLVALISILSCKKDDSPAEKSEFKIYTALVDGENIKWFGTDQGLLSIKDDNLKKHTDDVLNQEIRKLVQNSVSKEILIGTKNGVYSLTGNYDNYTVKQKYTKENSSLHSNTINTIDIGPKMKEWFGTVSGVSFNDNGTWEDNVHVELEESNVTSIAFIENHYFFCTLGEHLLHGKYDPGLDAVTGATWMNDGFSGKLTTDSIFCAIGDKDQDLWFGSTKGLTKSDKELTHIGDGKFEYFLEGERVRSVFQANNGDIWAGTETGVYKYDGSAWEQFDTSDGIPGNTVYAIAQETGGVIWIGTNKGIAKYDGSSWKTY